MTHVLLIDNPFDPCRNLNRHFVPDGLTVREWLREYFGPDFVEFAKPTVCQWNGELVLRADWETRRFKPGDVVAFVTVPQGIELIFIAIIALAVAVAAFLLMPDPKIPTDNTEGADSVYTLRGQTNRFRPNEPIEVSYGRIRTWPTYACRPYSRYIGNQQYQFSLFCLGQGYFDIHETQLDDTATADFTEVELEIVQPGGSVTLVESNVTTSLEVSNIELLGPNEDDYTGVSGPFVINESGTQVHRLEVDISFPSGLYSLNDEGKLRSETVSVLFEYREIDDDGDPVGSWQVLTGTAPAGVSITRSDNTPQRITYSKTVPAGRYQIRANRTSNKPDSTRKSTMVRWETAKGYAQNVGSFGNVTMIAMKALATNSLNDSSVKAFNVIATRKLPTWDPVDGWGPRVATRNPIWAFCDLFRSTYGAKLDSSFLDMPTLHALAVKYETRNDWFDWTFDGSIAVWEAAQMILRVGRAMPIPQGSLITAIRDEAQSLPAAVFNQHNIVAGTLSKKLQMFEFQPFDGLIVEYTEPDTWKTKEVKCVLAGSDGLNLDRLKLPGCTSRNRAYREGLVIQARRQYQRKTITFTTGLEGHIPAYMDLISITHDTIRVGQGGMILAYNPTTKEMTLSELVTFASDNLVHKIAIRGDDGAIVGTPITVTPGSGPNKVILAHDPDTLPDFSENRVPPLYAFGLADVWAFMGKVASIRPLDERSVEITAVNYVPGVYDLEDSETVEAIVRPIIKNRTNPAVEWVTITPVPDSAQRVFVDWLPVPGAVAYILQLSYDDGATWSPAGNYAAPPVEFGANLGTLKVRVAPFALNGNVIYTVSNSFEVGSNITPPPAPDALDPQPAFTGLTATAKWAASTGALGYIVEVYTASVLMRTVEVGTSLRVDYTFDDYTTDGGTGREIEFQVRAFNAGGQGTAEVITLTNPEPLAPTGLTVGTPTGTDYPVSWLYTAEGDELEFRVYASTTDGFTPGGGNLVATETDLDAVLAAPTRPLYWRVGTVDKWGTEVSLSAQAVIPA